MAFLISYADILLRADRYSHRTGGNAETGALDQTDRRRVAFDAWRQVHFQLVRGWPDGYGYTRRKLTIPVAGALVKLPDNFLSLEVYRRSDADTRCRDPHKVEPRVAERRGWYDGLNLPTVTDSQYFIEGPGIEFDENLQADVQYVQRIHAFPDFPVDTVVTLGYRTQAPSLGDPTDPNDSAVTVDMIADPIFAWVANEVRIAQAQREEQAELQRSRQSAVQIAGEVREVRGVQDDHGVQSADDFDISDRGVGHLAGY